MLVMEHNGSRRMQSVLALFLAAALCYGAAFSHILPALVWNVTLVLRFPVSTDTFTGPYYNAAVKPDYESLHGLANPNTVGKSGSRQVARRELRYYRHPGDLIPAYVIHAGDTYAGGGLPAYGDWAFPTASAEWRVAVPYFSSMKDFRQWNGRTGEALYVRAADLYEFRNGEEQKIAAGMVSRSNAIRQFYFHTDSYLYEHGIYLSPNLYESVLTLQSGLMLLAGGLCLGGGLGRLWGGGKRERLSFSAGPAALALMAALGMILPAAGWNAMLERNFEPSFYGRNGPYLSGEPLTYQKVSRCFSGKSGFTEANLGEAPGRMRFYGSANALAPEEVFEAGETVVVEGSPSRIESYGMNTYPGEKANRRFAVPYARSLADYHELLQQQREGTLKGCFVPAADLLYSCRSAMRQSMHRFPVGDGWGISGRRDLLRHLFHWTDSELYRRGCCISPNLYEPLFPWQTALCLGAALLCFAAMGWRRRKTA